jgi:hypothetical protein
MIEKICVYAISKNEEKNVEQFVENTRLFDHVFVLDTGSTDNTVALLKSHNISVFEKSYEQFDFSCARNDCISKISQDIMWGVWLDFNEKLNITRQDILSIVENNLASAFYARCFVFNYDEHKFVEIEKKIRIHRLSDYKWKRPVHEELVAVNTASSVLDTNIEFYKNSPPSLEKESFYYDLCYQEYIKNNDLIYLRFMLDYAYNKQMWENVKTFAIEFINKTTVGNQYFRPRAFILLSEYFVHKDQLDTARDMAFHALSEGIKQKYTFTFWLRDALKQLNKLGVEIKINDNIN